MANGIYIGFVDCDDYIEKSMYELLYTLIKEKNAEICVCNYIEHRKNEETIKEVDERIQEFETIEALGELVKTNITSHLWNRLYKKELWNDIVFPMGRKYEDLAIMYKIFEKANKVVYTNRIMYHYNRREDSITGNINKALIKDFKDMTNERDNYIRTKYPMLEEEINLCRINIIKMLHRFIALTKDKEMYNSEEYKQRYKDFKRDFKIYASKSLKLQKGFIRKFEILLFYFNRSLYYYMISIL